MSESFAELLRRHRLAADLTQEALAERAGLSVNGIQKLERGGTQPYRDTVRRLSRALQLQGDLVAEFEAAAQPAPRGRVVASMPEPEREPANVPVPLTSFVGRVRELQELVQVLPSTRLLTLTGVGGSGKTRLALEVARAVNDQYADGVRLVELAPVVDARLVPQAVAAALGIRETRTQSLMATPESALRRRQLLLLLDNCEHLLDAAAQLTHALLTSSLTLRILATSREPLGVAGEVTRRVPSLAVPPAEGQLTAEQIGAYEAVRLFIERARAFSPRIELTDRYASSIAYICARLDGIPLAIELAAALVRGMSVEDIASRLDLRFRLLTSGSRTALPRQQTLQATIDWSYDLLSAPEQELFARLSVFVGSWTLEAAEAVCSDEAIDQDEVLRLLLHLVDASLVVAEEAPDGSHRYRLLDTLGHYGRDQLLRLGQFDSLSGRHAAYFLALSERAAAELNQPGGASWVEELALCHADLLGALDWLIGRDRIQDALCLASVLGRFWQIRGHLDEGRRRLAALLAHPGAAEPTLARAHALEAAGALALYQGDMPATRALLKDSLALFRRHSDERGVAWVLIYLGWMAHDDRRPRAGRRLLGQALELCRTLGDLRGEATCLSVLGMTEESEGLVERARLHHDGALALSRQIGDHWITALALTNYSASMVSCGEVNPSTAEGIRAMIVEGMRLWADLGEPRHMGFSHMHLAMLAQALGDLPRAREELEHSLRIFEELQDPVATATTLTSAAYWFEAAQRLEDAVCLLAASPTSGGSLSRPIVLRRLSVRPRHAQPYVPIHLPEARTLPITPQRNGYQLGAPTNSTGHRGFFCYDARDPSQAAHWIWRRAGACGRCWRDRRVEPEERQRPVRFDVRRPRRTHS